MATIPSIALIPSGYKAGKVYSVLPTDGGADLTFTRVGALPSFNATRVNEEGLIEEVLSNVPRLDYSNGGCPALLVEPQSTNLLTYSEDFTNASYSKVSSTISSNVILAPNGTLTADKLIADTTLSQHRLDKTPISSAGNQTFSIYAKSSEYNFIFLRIGGLGSFFNLTTGVSSNLSVGITTKSEFIGNGWWRFSITNLSASANDICRINLSIDGSNSTFTGDGTSGVYIWGAQLEALPYATSYIPTVATTVTRVAETVVKTGLSDYINSNEGVLFVEISVDTTTAAYIELSDGTSSNRISTGYSNNLSVVRYVNATDNITLTEFAVRTSFNKLAVKWDANNVSLFLNGVKTDTTTHIDSVAGLNKINFSTASAFYGKVKQLKVFTTALSDTELIALTSN